MPPRRARKRPAEPHEVATALLEAITKPVPLPPTLTFRQRVMEALLHMAMGSLLIGVIGVLLGAYSVGAVALLIAVASAAGIALVLQRGASTGDRR